MTLACPSQTYSAIEGLSAEHQTCTCLSKKLPESGGLSHDGIGTKGQGDMLGPKRSGSRWMERVVAQQ